MDEQRSPDEAEIVPTPPDDSPWRRPDGRGVQPVDDATEPERDEKLTSADDAVDWDASTFGGGRRRNGRRRLLAVGAGVVIVGLFAWWAIGRSGSEPTPDAVVSQVSTTARTAAPTTPPPPVSTLPQLEPVTTAPVATSGPVTTIAAGWTSRTRDYVDSRVQDLGTRIIAVRPGELLEFDTSSNELATTYMRTDFRQAPYLDAGEDWILVRHTDTAQTQLFRGRDDPVRIEAGEPWSTYRQPGTDRFWMGDPLPPLTGTLVEIGETVEVGGGVPTVVDAPQQRRFTEIDHEGNVTGASLETSSHHSVLGSDPAGGIVVAAPGGAYHLGVEGSARLTAGGLIALSAATVLALDCGDALTTCGLIVIDRATGESTPLVPVMPDSIVSADSMYVYGRATLYGSMPLSPDDRYAPIVVSGSRQSFGVIDLTTGEYTDLSGTPQSALWWTPDSRAVMYLSGRRLLMYDFDAREAFEILPDYEDLWSFTVRT